MKIPVTQLAQRLFVYLPVTGLEMNTWGKFVLGIKLKNGCMKTSDTDWESSANTEQ